MALKHALGGILLISGTSIGAALLSLPLGTAELGFGFSLSCFLITWVFMTLGALYLLEANLMVGHHVNLITMAQKTLGPLGLVSAWISYLLLLYALIAAYLNGSGALLVELCEKRFDLSISHSFGMIWATGVTGLIVILGTFLVDVLNRGLMIGLFLTFGFMALVSVKGVNPDLLFEPSHHFSPHAFPLIVTAFGFAIIIPTLTDYLEGNAKQLAKVILIGSLIPLLLYILWQYLIMGLIPLEGSPSLLELKQNDQPAVELSQALGQLLTNPLIVLGAKGFVIFALITSLLGVSLSLFDFLSDGLHFSKSIKGRILTGGIAFVPPLILALWFSAGFSYTLSFAGIFVAIILGLLPVAMVYSGRYYKHLSSEIQIPGGKPLLWVTALFFIAIILIEVKKHLF